MSDQDGPIKIVDWSDSITEREIRLTPDGSETIMKQSDVLDLLKFRAARQPQALSFNNHEWVVHCAMKSLHRWAVFKVASAALFIVRSPAMAQWQVPDHSVPVGRGPGLGFKFAAPGSPGFTLTSNGATSDPSFGQIGSGALPSPFTNGTASGNTSKFATTTGTLTNGNCVKLDANGNFVDAGAACGTGGGGNLAAIVYVTEPPYNAACNGSTDDSSAIQAAINAMPASGGVLGVPAGRICNLQRRSTSKRTITSL